MAEAQPQSQVSSAQVLPEKAFPVSWDQFHRDARALAWRLAAAGPFTAIVAITRGGLVPAAIVSRELLLSVFRENGALHDGAVIVQKDRIASAACFLPLTDADESGSAPRTARSARAGVVVCRGAG